MTSPLARMIDEAVRCLRCGKNRIQCACPSMLAFDVVLPLPPNMANGRMHWRVKNRKREAYNETCDEWQNSSVIPRPPKTPHTFVELRALLTLWNPMDDDGAMARVKWSLDWLVTRGYLAGDSRKHVRWIGMPEQVIDRKHHGTVVFRVQPLG